ncbi:mitotic-spindle organizing protein 1 [Cryptococcus depauperatus]
MVASMQEEASLRNANDTIDTLYDLSQLLQTGLEKTTLLICVGLIEQGANPDTLAAVIQDLREENEALKLEKSSQSV